VASRTSSGASLRIEQIFTVARPPEAVFDYLTDPSKVSEWQTAKTSIEPLTNGPPRLGSRVRERTKRPGGGEFEQVVEFTEFERPRQVRTHIVEGPYPVDGSGTRVRFVAEGQLRGPMRLLGPLASRMIARQFRAYHENLRRNLEAGSSR
jgi:uncharacterized protein YndB with AHSA1/START domain